MYPAAAKLPGIKTTCCKTKCIVYSIIRDVFRYGKGLDERTVLEQ